MGPPLSAPVLFLRDRFGGDFEQADGTVSVATGGTQLTQNDPECVALTFVNNGTDTVWLTPNNSAAADVGLQLLPGGSVSLTVRDDATLPTREWWGAANSSTQSVYYLKIRRYVTVSQAGAPGGG